MAASPEAKEMKETLSGSGDSAQPTAYFREELSAGPKQRGSGRLTLAVPILLIGTDDEGRVFSEGTSTVVLSRYGAGIVSRQKFLAEQELVLRVLKSGREAEVRVVGEIGNHQNSHTYGVAFVNEEVDFWQVEFPPSPVWRPVGLILQCGGCKQLVELKDGDFGYDICPIHGGLARFCNECGLLTVWRRSTESPDTKAKDKTPEPAQQTDGDLADLEPATPKTEEFVSLADAMEGVERRARVRAKVKFSACVRSEAFRDDIVQSAICLAVACAFAAHIAITKKCPCRLPCHFRLRPKMLQRFLYGGELRTLRSWPKRECGVEFLR